jgi:hypothetical protein
MTSQVYEEKSKVAYTTSWRNTLFHKLEKKTITNNRLMKIIVRAKIKSTARKITIYFNYVKEFMLKNNF